MPKSEIQTLRRRLLTQGAERLSDADLLGVVLNSCSLARALVHRNADWWEQSPHELSRIPRFSIERVAQVLGLVELAQRIMTTPLVRGEALRCSEQVAAAYGPRLAGKDQECFIALSLDNRNRVIAEHEVARGAMNNVVVDPRLVFRRLIQDGAAATIVVHNHPSGDPSPSGDDMNMCRRLTEAGRLVGVNLLDFVIVAGGAVVSFADQDMMLGGER